MYIYIYIHATPYIFSKRDKKINSLAFHFRDLQAKLLGAHTEGVTCRWKRSYGCPKVWRKWETLEIYSQKTLATFCVDINTYIYNTYTVYLFSTLKLMLYLVVDLYQKWSLMNPFWGEIAPCFGTDYLILYHLFVVGIYWRVFTCERCVFREFSPQKPTLSLLPPFNSENALRCNTNALASIMSQTS